MPEGGPGLSLRDRQGCHTAVESELVGATAAELYKALGSKTEPSAASHVQSARKAEGLWFDGHTQWGLIRSPDKLMTY